MRPRNLMIVAAAIPAIFLICLWLLPLSGELALAQVQQQVEKLNSVQFTESFKVKDATEETAVRHMILGDSLATRSEGTAGTDLGRYVETIDENRSLTVFPEKKGYVLFPFVHSAGGTEHDSSEKKHTWRGIFDELLRKPADSMKRLPEKVVDGKSAVGFVTEREEKTGRFVTTSRRTYWIDTKTKLPVRIDVTTRSTNPETKDVDGSLSDFVFDAPLAPALFSTEPPKGYTDIQPKATTPPEKPLPPGHTVPLGKTVPSKKYAPAPEKTTPGKTDR